MAVATRAGVIVVDRPAVGVVALPVLEHEAEVAALRVGELDAVPGTERSPTGAQRGGIGRVDGLGHEAHGRSRG